MTRHNLHVIQHLLGGVLFGVVVLEVSGGVLAGRATCHDSLGLSSGGLVCVTARKQCRQVRRDSK